MSAAEQNNFVYYSDLAESLKQTGDLNSALSALQRAVELNPQHAGLHYNLGNLYRELKQRDSALESYKQSLVVDPKFYLAANNIGECLRELGELELALQAYKQASALEPRFAVALVNQGVVNKLLNQPEAALTCFLQAVALDNKQNFAFYNLGVLQHELGMEGDAYQSLSMANSLNPQHVNTIIALGRWYRDQAQVDEARLCFARACQLAPENADARYERAHIELLEGEWQLGWQDYRYRFLKTDPVCDFSLPTIPFWNGEAITGKTLFIYGEQGVGDELLFAGAWQELQQQGAKLVVSCDERLLPVFRRSFSDIRFHSKDDKAIQADYQMAAGDVYKIIPVSQKTYLQADEALIKQWQERFAAISDKPKIGIAWRGGVSEQVQRRRSIALDNWQPLLSQLDADLINLQYGDVSDEIQAFKSAHGVTIQEFADVDSLKEFEQSAAMLKALDCVIAIDNSTVHLAGALGVKTFVLLAASPEWRWGLNKASSAWYQSLVLIRQQELGDWNSVFASLQAEADIQSLMHK